MRNRKSYILYELILAAGLATPSSQALAQYNPLLPAGVGSGTEYSGGYYGGGAGIGRGKGPVPEGGDANPAETLLRQMEGTNYGHHTGHAYFRGQPASRAARVRRSTPASRPPATVRYDRRGDYERKLYLRSAKNRRPDSRPGAPGAAKRSPNPLRYY